MKYIAQLTLSFLLIFSLVNGSYAAGHFVSWPDDAICTWVKIKPNNAGYQSEAASRGLSCGGLVKDVSAPNIERFTKDQPDVNDDYQRKI